MLQWKLTSARQLQLEENPPQPIDDFANTKVKLEQIMLTVHDFNLYARNNDGNTVLGRFGVGVVSETSEGNMLTKMDRVLISPSLPCNNCTNCRDGHHQDCLNVKELAINTNGLLQNFYNVHSNNLYKLPDSLSDKQALYVPLVAMAINAVDRMSISKGQHVAIWGNSRMGIILAQVLSYYKAVPILICNDSDTVTLAKSKYGIFYAFNSNECDVKREVQIVTGGNMCHNSVLLANSPYTLSDVVSLSAVNCTICVTGTLEEDSTISLSDIVANHINIVGSYNGIGSFDTAINLIVTKQVSVKEFEVPHLNFAHLDEELAELLTTTKPLAVIVDVD